MGKRSVNLQIIINYNLKYIANLHTFNYHIKKSRHIFNIHYFIQFIQLDPFNKSFQLDPIRFQLDPFNKKFKRSIQYFYDY